MAGRLLSRHARYMVLLPCPTLHTAKKSMSRREPTVGTPYRLLKAIDVQDCMATRQRGHMQTGPAEHATLRAVRDAHVVCHAPAQGLDSPRRTGARDQGTTVVDPKHTSHYCGAHPMPKERNSRKEAKKKPTMTPKEKKAAKQSKKASTRRPSA